VQRHSVTRRRDGELAGIGLAVGAAVAFGTLAVSGKLAYRAGADPLLLLSVRFALASVLLALFRLVARKRRTPPTKAQVLRLLALGGLGYAFEASLFFAALDLSPAAVVSLVFYSYPLWTAVFGFVTRLEPFRPQFLMALALGTFGVAVIFGAPAGGLAGPLLALGAAFAVAVYFIGIQVWARGVDPSASALWTSVGAAAATGVAGLIAGQSFPIEALPAAGALAIASAVAFIGAYAAIARIGSPRAAVAGMMEPVTTVILAALFLGEALSWRIAGGTVLIVGSLPVLALAGPHPGVEGVPEH
jgi:drug/metabolite transporter (DMT)-like permease